MGKQRIVILGGGMGALTAAFEITDAPGWQEQYEVTVHQLGWRLGGKGASGRNAAHAQRIEEHGLHILLGFYENAFKVLRKAYGELGRPAGAPLATWQDAFKPHDYVVLTEQLPDGSYVPWAMDFPPNSGVPGEGGVLPTPWQFLQMITGWLKQIFDRTPALPDRHPSLDAAHQSARVGHESGVLGAIHDVHTWLHAEKETLLGHVDWRRDFITLDLGFAAVKGIVASGVLRHGDWFKLDDRDFRAWLAAYGARDESVNSAYISGMYDLGFSLPGQVGAGTAINGILRMCWTYKGAVMWKMQAGMGDTIFGPLYEVLRRRGVRFEFFSRVDDLQLSDDGTRIANVTIGRQATPIAGEYDPLVDVEGLPCWPSEPKYELLVEGEALKASGQDVEDWWTTWKDPQPPRVLRDGVDFDQVILGCSLGVFPYIAKDVIARNKPFADMVANVATTQTQAAQLWMSTDLAGLGWTLPSPVLDGYAEPMDTWADMTHLLGRETWPVGNEPKNLAYLCSPLPDDEWPLPPRDQHGYTQRQEARVVENTRAWLENSARGLWPKFHPSLLVGGFDNQYWIATMNPSDRYVLATPNSVNFRLTTRGHGIANLLLAGDYIKTGMNVGCVEAATMGGMHASRAICGRPSEIVGDLTDEPVPAPSPAIAGGTPYIERGGDLAMMPPLALKDTTMYAFAMAADLGALQALCDRELNAVTAASGVTFKPLLPMVSLVCADVVKSYSTTPPDSQKGWMAERDFGMWVPVVSSKGDIGWYLPYVFVDNVAAMVTGREVFGFFKQTAALAMPPSPSSEGAFTVDALAIRTYAPTSHAETMRLVSATSTQPGVANTGTWTSAAHAVEELASTLTALHGAVSGVELAKDVIKMLISGDVPMFFLKQFRDASAQDRACYQAVIAAPARLDAWKKGWFTHPHDITIAPADSHPIARDCGLPSGTVRSTLGFWCTIDFTMMPGRVIASR